MTAMPGSGAQTAPEPALLTRFTTTERVLHWAHAAAFFGMLATGLVLYLPSLSSLASRPQAKALHLGVAIAWLTSLALVAVAGNRRQLRRTRMEIERFVGDDLQWLMGRRAPQGRFNAGQKIHTVIQAAIAGLFTISGTLLWLGERNTSFRLSGSVALHDGAMYVAVVLVIGHLFLSLVWPHTRPALRGMVRGSVRADWAARHHAAWVPTFAAPVARSRRRFTSGAVTVVVGLLAGWWVVAGATNTGATPPAARPVANANPSRPPARITALQLAAQAQALDQSGDLTAAISLYRRAVGASPRRADLQAALGFALARSGDRPSALSTLDTALKLDPSLPDAHLYLGAILLHRGNRALTGADRRRGRREIQRFLTLTPTSPNAPAARRLLHAARRRP